MADNIPGWAPSRLVPVRPRSDGSYNTAYGLDGIFRLWGDDYFSFNWAQTFENGKDNTLASLELVRPLSSNRALMVKYSYTFNF